MAVLFLTVVIDLIGFGIIIPIIPFLAPQLGGNDTDIALVIATYSICAAISGMFWGKLSDRYGRKPIILICLGGTAIAHLMLAFSTSLTIMYLARALTGLMAGIFGVATAMIADITTVENRAKGMGLIGAGYGVGFVIGPFIGGLLSGDDMSVMRPGLAAAGFSLAAMIAGAFILKESLPAEKRAAHAAEQTTAEQRSIIQILRESGNTLLILQFFLLNMCVAAVGYLFPLMARDFLSWGPKEVGMVFGVQGLLVIIIQSGIIGRFTKLFGELESLIIGLLIMVSGLVVYMLIADTATTIVAGILLAYTGATFGTPILNSLTSQRTPAHVRGQVMGMTASMAALGRVVSPLIAGFLLQLGGFSFAWCFAVVCGLTMVAWTVSEVMGAKAHKKVRK